MAISAEFTADFSQFTAAAQGAQEAVGGVVTTASALDIERQTTIATRAIATLGREVTTVASAFVAAYAEEEAAAARVKVALEQQGTASTAVIDAYQRMAEQFQNTTRFSDDAVASAQALFTSIGTVGPAQMEPAIQAAANLAAQLGISLPAAARMLATAIESGGTKLGQLNRYFGETDLKGKSAAEQIELFNSKFRGAAQADMQTTAGQIANLNNKFDDLKGKVGELLATALTPLLTAFSSLPASLQTLIVAVGVLGTALAPIAIAFGAVVSAIGPLVAMLGGGAGLMAAFSGLLPFLGPAGLIAAGVLAVYLAFKNWDKITAIAQAVYQGVKTWLVDRFTALVDLVLAPIRGVVAGFQWMADKIVLQSIVPDMISGIGRQFGHLDRLMVAPARAATAHVLSDFQHMTQQMTAIVTDAGGIARNAFGQVVTPGLAMGNLPRTMGVNITINGSVLGNKDEIARVVGDAVSRSYRTGGNRWPV